MFSIFLFFIYVYIVTWREEGGEVYSKVACLMSMFLLKSLDTRMVAEVECIPNF